jgi:hypothetical protein
MQDFAIIAGAIFFTCAIYLIGYRRGMKCSARFFVRDTLLFGSVKEKMYMRAFFEEQKIRRQN